MKESRKCLTFLCLSFFNDTFCNIMFPALMKWIFPNFGVIFSSLNDHFSRATKNHKQQNHPGYSKYHTFMHLKNDIFPLNGHDENIVNTSRSTTESKSPTSLLSDLLIIQLSNRSLISASTRNKHSKHGQFKGGRQRKRMYISNMFFFWWIGTWTNINQCLQH